MALNTHSIRERALQALQATLCTIRRNEPPTNQPNADGYQFDLEAVNIIRTPLTENQFRANAAVGILENDGTLNHELQTDRNILNVTLELFLRVPPDEEPSTCFNAFLTDIHRCIRDNRTLDDLVSAITIESNAVDPDSYQDRQIDGAMFVILSFKTAEDDPRERVPGVIPA